jgi:adenylate cyclase
VSGPTGIRADSIRECFDGAVPGYVATCAPDGTPNVTACSQVQYVDCGHVALSYQFFNKTRRNVLANPRVRLLLVHPRTAAQYRLVIEYLRTETEGPLFESMKAKLAGIASHTGMSGVFRLLGSDVYRILDIERVPGNLVVPPPQPNLLTALRSLTEALGACPDLEALLAAALDGLQARFGVDHAMVLMLDGSGRKLYTVASRGYEISGVGSEIPLGQGVIGVCAQAATPIRIGHMTSEAAYGRAIRASAEQGGLGAMLETEIPLPGLQDSASQLAVPIRAHGQVQGVLYVESPVDLRFSYDEEDALVVLAGHLGLAIQDLQACPESVDEPVTAPRPSGCEGSVEPLVVRHYVENDSIFLGDDYLIKGVAGSIFWALAQDFSERGRCDFSNRELRLDPRIKLPDLSDNLEARLVLLAKRLAERGACAQILKTGRGRFRLQVERPLRLQEIG